jgi:tetratricopeptide (TPR) repeat protein
MQAMNNKQTFHTWQCRSATAHLLAAAIGAAFVLPSAAQHAVQACGALTSSYGPFDYRTAKKELEPVEQFHFTPNVEALIRGNSGTLAGELNYTLGASPNHHRALLAMVRLAEREKSPQANGARFTVECYFDRALRFRSDDTVARMMYAQWLQKNRREADARAQLGTVAEQAGDNAFTHYNLGLLYLDMKAYDLALLHAHKAMELGFTRTELRDQLRKAGKWTDPVAATSSQGAASAASAATN